MAVVKIDNKIPLVGGKAIEVTEAQITTEPIVITSNGTVNVPSGKRYAPIVTNVPQGITPSGSIEISENDTYDVTEYAEAVVNVPQGITPTGNINITDTNVTDVTNYATAQVVDADLVAENIKKDVNILGVVGSFEGGGSAEYGLEDAAFNYEGFASGVISSNQLQNYSVAVANKGVRMLFKRPIVLANGSTIKLEFANKTYTTASFADVSFISKLFDSSNGYNPFASRNFNMGSTTNVSATNSDYPTVDIYGFLLTARSGTGLSNLTADIHIYIDGVKIF